MKFTLYKFIAVFALFLTAAPAPGQSEKDTGIQLYQKADYKGAIAVLRKATRTNAADAVSWYYLGLSYLRKDEINNSVDAFKKAVELAPADAQVRTGLAYANLRRNKLGEAEEGAAAAIRINPKIPEAHYISGVVSLRRESYSGAYEKANKALEVKPDFAPAYLLKAEALVSNLSRQAGTVLETPNSRGAPLVEAAEAFEKYLSLSPSEKTKFNREYLDSLKFFAEYYRAENEFPGKTDAADAAQGGVTPLKIISKPRPSYTDEARKYGVSGIVILLVGFGADGKVKHILVLKPLSHGLSEQSVMAARKIKFEPPTRGGKPLAAVKTVEYSFMIY